MIKTLLRKQFLELNSFYFIDRKTGKRRSKKSIIVFSLLFVLVFFSVFMAFMGVSDSLAKALLPGTMWLYFAIMGIMTIFVGLFGSVFTTYVSVFKAGDNEMLLSMPIAAGDIIFVRMMGVIAMSLFYTSLAWLPALLRVILAGCATGKIIIFGIVCDVLISLLVSALCCLVGWVVAVLSTKFTGKSKNLIIIVVSLVFFIGYYFVCFRMQHMLEQLVASSETIGVAVKAWVFPIYHLGCAASGESISFIIFAAISIGAMAICYAVMSKSFLKIATANRGEKKVAYVAKESKSSSIKKALLKREFRHFIASPAYLINTGLGLGIIPIIGIMTIVKSEMLIGVVTLLEELLANISELLPIVAAGMLCLIISMNAISAPSISLEGRAIWILRSTPVKAADVFGAKEKMAIILNGTAAIVGAVLMGIGLKFSVQQIAFTALITIAYVMVHATLGLVLGIKRPNLDWTNETVPVKQSMPVVIVLFGGWVISIIIIAGGFLTNSFISANIYMIIVLAVLAIVWRLLRGWLYTKGCRIFDTL